jgi:hypothetical protein
MSKPNFTLRFDPKVRALAEKVSQAERRSLTNLIEIALVEYAERHGFSLEQKDEGKSA